VARSSEHGLDEWTVVARPGSAIGANVSRADLVK
jgi:hypothetical protein